MLENQTRNLFANPFAVLGVTMRDHRARIMEAADDCSLSHDSEACQQARAILTNPRRRLEAEIGWMPGVAPGRSSDLLSRLRQNPIEAVQDSGLGGLALANCIATAMTIMSSATSDDLTESLLSLAQAAEEINPDHIWRDINEERAVAGFPLVASVDNIGDALHEQRRIWLAAAGALLARLPTMTMVQGLSHAVTTAEDDGAIPALLDDIVDGYSLGIQPFLEVERANAEKLLAKMISFAETRPDAIDPLIDCLADLLNTWEQITQPVQVSLAGRGQVDAASRQLAWRIRGVAVELVNEHGLIDQAQRITDLLDTNFASIPEVAEKTLEDSIALDGLAAAQAEQEASNAAWAQEIAYSAEIGTFFKDRIALSASGIEWRNEHFALEEITWCRWGAVSKSMNGIPTGTDYLVAFGGGGRSAEIDFTNGKIFEGLVPRLWQAVGTRIMFDMCRALGSGKQYRMGNAIVRDETVVIIKRRTFGQDEEIEVSWRDIKVSAENGSFVIISSANPKLRAMISYRDVPNAHFMEHIVRTNFKKGITKMSALIEG